MPSLYVARHGETVFNASRRMQGEEPHTPLTRAGFDQADMMGKALLARLGREPPLMLWSSPTGRALQTLAIIAEHLGLDWHQARVDPRLSEMHVGDWSGRGYDEIAQEAAGFLDRRAGLFTMRPPGGEWYDDIAARLRGWIEETGNGSRDRLVVMHGISSRVLRGLLTGASDHPLCGAPMADALPQGSIVRIHRGEEEILHLGSGGYGASARHAPA